MFTHIDSFPSSAWASRDIKDIYLQVLYLYIYFSSQVLFVSPGRSYYVLAPVSFCDGLDLVRLGLGGEFDGGDELLLLPHDFLRLDLDLFPSLYHLQRTQLEKGKRIELFRRYLENQSTSVNHAIEQFH